jgi:hypothetical protein
MALLQIKGFTLIFSLNIDILLVISKHWTKMVPSKHTNYLGQKHE